MLLSPAFVRVLFDIPLLLRVYVGGICVRLGVCACGWFECVWPLKGRCSRNLLKVNPHVFVYTMSVCVYVFPALPNYSQKIIYSICYSLLSW